MAVFSGIASPSSSPGLTGNLLHLVKYLQSTTFATVKRILHIALSLLLLLPAEASAQNHIREAMKRAKQQREQQALVIVNSENGKSGGGYMRFQVDEKGDTTYLDVLEPIWIFAQNKGKGKNWRDYYQLVWRFGRVYPYAEVAGQLVAQVDSVVEANHYGRLKRDRYISQVQKQLFNEFEGSMRKMSIQQGALLIKLIARETGQSPYAIIKEYKSGITAGFWQGIARLFDNNLKDDYDPEGEDKDIEELIQIWKEGHYRDLYWSIFWEEPPVVVVPEIHL